MTHPYKDLPAAAFWRSAVAEPGIDGLTELWQPGFQLTRKTPVATFGSCFAQHISQALVQQGFHWVNTEPAPAILTAERAARFHYNIFSARTGNLYTTTLLRQWARWASGETPIPNEVWEQQGRFYDPFRPAIEPAGFASAEEVRCSRQATVAAFGQAIQQARVLIFTLGLTESWWHRETGVEYPMCPGTVAGTFDPSQHQFLNQDYPTVKKGLQQALKTLRQLNPKLRVILTVSPVPLTATCSDHHVLVASSESKSILRAVAGAVAQGSGRYDYFPSYELITSPMVQRHSSTPFYAPNQRQVTPAGVQYVLRHFFTSLGEMPPTDEGHTRTPVAQAEHPVGQNGDTTDATPANAAQVAATTNQHTTRSCPIPTQEEPAADVCEEALLEAFGPLPEAEPGAQNLPSGSAPPAGTADKPNTPPAEPVRQGTSNKGGRI